MTDSGSEGLGFESQRDHEENNSSSKAGVILVKGSRFKVFAHRFSQIFTFFLFSSSRFCRFSQIRLKNCRFKVQNLKVAADILREKWPLGRDGLLGQGYCQPMQKTINTLRYRDLQYL